MSFGFAQLPTFDLGKRELRPRLRRRLPRHMEFAGGAHRGIRRHAARPPGHARRLRPGGVADVAHRRQRRRVAAGEPGHRRCLLALGLAHVILREKLRPGGASRATAHIDGWAAGLPAYAPEQVSTVTGVPVGTIERLAREFAERGPAVAIVGGVPLAHTNGLFTALAVNALNQLAGAVGQPGGVLFTPQIARPAAGARTTLAQFASGQAPQLLLLDDVNPVFTAPAAMKVREAIGNVPFVVSFASFVDETSVLADLILPDHSFLESWTDALPSRAGAR